MFRFRPFLSRLATPLSIILFGCSSTEAPVADTASGGSAVDETSAGSTAADGTVADGTVADATSPAPSSTSGVPTEDDASAGADGGPVEVVDYHLTGFSAFPVSTAPATFDAGYSIYVALWPIQQDDPGPEFQTGVISAWLTPAVDDRAFPGEAFYNTIEGGVGWWTGTRFLTPMPKFTVGAVSNDFFEWANGPGTGGGTADADPKDWDVPQGKYGVAQLSNRLLWPPDGLTFEPSSSGDFLGYGYTPLPLIDAQDESLGEPLQTGDRSWTLFFDAENFKGPAAFIVPNFFSKPALDEPSLQGWFFDSQAADPASIGSLGLENHYIPAKAAFTADGRRFARIAPTTFPANADGGSRLYTNVRTFSDEALTDDVAAWWHEGADAPTGSFALKGVYQAEVYPEPDFEWLVIEQTFEEVVDLHIDMAAFATPIERDGGFEFQWTSDLVVRDGDLYRIPEYYLLDEAVDGDPIWRPVPSDEAPLALRQASFTPEPRVDTPFTTPTRVDSPWLSPGPTAGPFDVEISDGTVVTYSWYRFVDQPAIAYWQLSADHREALQARVEQIHSTWSPGDRFLPGLTGEGELADFDSALLLTPPAGLEVGYVPIVTRQARVE